MSEPTALVVAIALSDAANDMAARGVAPKLVVEGMLVAALDAMLTVHGPEETADRLVSIIAEIRQHQGRSPTLQ